MIRLIIPIKIRWR